MSESNNNVPIPITQLQEATVYEDGMYLPVAKAGSGTKKMNVNKSNPSDVNISKGFNNLFEIVLTWEVGLYSLTTGLPNDAATGWRKTQKFNYCFIPILDYGLFLESYAQNFFVEFWDNNYFIGSYNYFNNKYYDSSYTETTAITGYNTIAFSSQTTVSNSILETISIKTINSIDLNILNLTKNIKEINCISENVFNWEVGMYSLTTGLPISNNNWYRTQKHNYSYLPKLYDTAQLENFDFFAILWYGDNFVGTYNYSDGKYRNSAYVVVDNPIKFDNWAITCSVSIQLVPKESLLNRIAGLETNQLFNLLLRNKRTRKILGSKDKLKIGLIGDSLTVGVIGPNVEQGIPYAQYLSYLTGNANYALIATAGATAKYIYEHWLNVIDVSSYNLFIIMLGTNGYLNGDFETAKDDPTTQIYYYCKIIDKCLVDTQGQCKILLMNPPNSDDPNRTETIKNTIHVNVEKIGNYYGVPVLDLKYASLLDPSDAEVFNQEDKVHLTNKGYEIVANMIYDYLIDNYSTMTAAKQYTIPT